MAAIVSRPVVKLRRHTDDYFFAGMSLLILGSVFLGFAHSYYLAGTVHAHLPSAIIHVHAVIFSSWILLFITQIALVSIGKIAWHKRLGIFGAVLACLMVIFGVLAATDSARRHFAPPGVDSPTILAIEATELSVFAFLSPGDTRAPRWTGPQAPHDADHDLSSQPGREPLALCLHPSISAIDRIRD